MDDEQGVRDIAGRMLSHLGYADDPVMAGYKDYGFSGMVAKPYSLAELGKALNDVIG
jgi:hypothetical protein